MIKIKLEVPKYNPDIGMRYNWEKGFDIETKIENSSIVIKANKEGLISLANHLLNLAQDNVSAGYHMHFDDNNSLEEGSSELIIQKK